jgi:hypothetical protein
MEFFIWVLVVVLMTAIGYRAMIIVAVGFAAAGIVLPSLLGILSGLWLCLGATLMGPDDTSRRPK